MLRRLLLLVVACFGVGGFAQEAAFTPKVSTIASNPVALEVNPRHGMMTLKAEVNGVPCTLLFDTGASHTTFDRAFVEQHLPTASLHPITLGGDTNVREQPAAFKVETLTLGKATLREFYGMALPLEHLSKQMGLHIDGILGINVMGYAPFILDVANGRVWWLPPSARPIDAVRVPTVEDSAKRTIRLLGKRSQEGEELPILIDSGSSYSFFTPAQWPSAPDGTPVAMKTGDVNETASANFVRGAEHVLYLGDHYWFLLSPYLSETPEAVLGVDALKRLRLYIDAKQKRVLVLNRKGGKPSSPKTLTQPKQQQ